MDTTTHPQAAPLIRLLQIVALFLCALLTGLLLWEAWLILGFSYEKSWMEGAVVDHVARLRDGENIFVAPSPEFVPYIYTPLYYYIGAIFSSVLGEGLFALRLLTTLCTLSAAFSAGALVYFETRKVWPGLLTGGLFLGTYPLSATYMTMARVDALFVALILAAILLVRAHPATRGQIAAGVLFFLAFLTKQSTLPIAAAFALYALIAHRGLARYAMAVSFGALLSISVVAYQWFSDGWFWYYVFEIPGQHRFRFAMVPRFLGEEFLLPFIATAVLVVTAITLRFESAKQAIHRNSFWPILFLALFTTALLSRGHTGGFTNVLMPWHALVAIAAGLAVFHLANFPKLAATAWILVIAQLITLLYMPGSSEKYAGKTMKAEQLLSCLRSFEGHVFVPETGFVSKLAGQPPSAHEQAIADVFRAGSNATIDTLREQLATRISSRQYAALFLRNRLEDEFADQIHANYVFAGFTGPFGRTLPGSNYMTSKLYVAKDFTSAAVKPLERCASLQLWPALTAVN